MTGIELPWRSEAERAVILMGDAPPHDPEPFTGYTSNSVIAAARASSGTSTLMETLNGVGRASVRIHTVEVEEPTATGNDDPQPAFERLANETGGTFFRVTPDTTVTSMAESILFVLIGDPYSPIAVAGGPYTGAAGSPITFSGSDSYALYSLIEYYEWDFDNDGVFDSISTDPAATYTYPNAYNGAVTLRVTDYDGFAAIDTASVTVQGPIPATGLGLWLHADTGVTLNGTAVSQWADQSGNNHTAGQSTAANQPQLISNALNGKPAIRFDGTDDFLSATYPINGLDGLTMFLVSANRSATTPSPAQRAALFWNETAAWGATFLTPRKAPFKRALEPDRPTPT